MPQPHALLTDDEQYQVCRWYGEFKSPTQIRGLIKSEFGKEISLKNVWQYANGKQMKKWKPLIERLRQEWALGVMDIPLAHKRARLEKLVTLLVRAERNPDVTDFQKVKQCVEVLREMREEMEAGKAEFTNVYMTTIHTYSDEEIIRQRDVILSRLKLLGRGDGVRRIRQETDGAIEVEATVESGGDGDGGGLHRGLVGSPDAAAPNVAEDSQGAGVPVLGGDDARSDGASIEGASAAQGTEQAADGSLRLRDDAEDGVGPQAGAGEPIPGQAALDAG